MIFPRPAGARRSHRRYALVHSMSRVAVDPKLFLDIDTHIRDP